MSKISKMSRVTWQTAHSMCHIAFSIAQRWLILETNIFSKSVMQNIFSLFSLVGTPLATAPFLQSY